MTRIDGASGIAALIRAQALEQARLRQAQGQGEQARSADGTAKEGSGDARVLAPLLRRLKGMDAADPDRRRKAFRMFMEATLVRELGEALRADPQFPGLVDQVLQRMEDDPELQAASLEAADHLLEEAARWGDEGPDASPR
ncbi:MAG: hypothetical protein LBV56_18570 [Delftia acidovorans]|jgi:hypothetical protein|nr:hypothetical protein [Delftia acidovorans]